MSLTSVWSQAQEHIKDKIGPTSYETWFSAIHVKEFPEGTLLIESPDNFFKSWILDHYQTLIEDILGTLSSDPIKLEFGINTIPNKEEGLSVQPSEKIITQANPSIDIGLDSRFTFENFVIGSSNRFACAASLAVAESPAKAYNPLFIYGKVGLGKTHLIQAITKKIQKIHPQLKISFLTSEQFTNELINSIRHKSTTAFRKKYRSIDVLLIDDIQFIAGKESTQEEFFHTFNCLHNSRKQIIITSDRAPKEIPKLEERLISRFAWGLIADIQPPDFETRVAILKKKVEKEPVQVPDDIIFFIAEQIKTNIRELEGALIRVTAYALLEEKPLSLEMAKHILKDMVQETAKNIQIETVQKKVAQFFNIAVAELRAKRRCKNIVRPRQIAMFLSRQLTKASLPEIGSAFGGKDHTTVLHSCKKIEQEVNDDPDMRNTIQQLISAIQE